MTCEHCGARLDPNALACSFCKAPTPLATQVRARQEEEARVRAAWQAQSESQKAIAVQRRMESLATHALAWSIVGAFMCCLPVSAIGVVQGLRARNLANQLHMPFSGKARTGLILGILGSITSIVLVTVGFVGAARDQEAADARIAQLETSIGPRAKASTLGLLVTVGFIGAARDQEAADARIAQLETSIGPRAKAPTLEHDVACALAEIHTRKSGFESQRGSSLDHFECVGRLSGGASEAQLENFRFTKSTTKFDVNVCFKRGAQWFVQDVQRDACARP